MSEPLDKIFAEVTAFYANLPNGLNENRQRPKDKISPCCQQEENRQSVQLDVINLIGFSSQYIKAAGVVDDHLQFCFLPRLQLTGQSIELALKAYILSASHSFKQIHELKPLCVTALKHSVVLGDKEIEGIAHVGHAYDKDLCTGTKYKSRYPAQKLEAANFHLPSHSTLNAIVASLNQQATDRISQNICDCSPE